MCGFWIGVVKYFIIEQFYMQVLYSFLRIPFINFILFFYFSSKFNLDFIICSKLFVQMLHLSRFLCLFLSIVYLSTPSLSLSLSVFYVLYSFILTVHISILCQEYNFLHKYTQICNEIWYAFILDALLYISRFTF